MCEEMLVYECEENDNEIKIIREDGRIVDEIWVGCKDDPNSGYHVIAIKDLDNALARVGYFIGKVGGF